MSVTPITTVVPNGDTIELVMPYSTAQMNGVTILVVISCISLVSVVSLLSAIGLSAFNTRSSLDQHLFVRTHMAAYFISLLFCDILQAIGSILNAEWLKASSVHVGTICTAQAIIKHMSDVGTAIWTLIIAFHTFFLLVLEWKARKIVLWTVIIGGWSLIGALVIAGPAALDTRNRGPFFSLSGSWCWISPTFPGARITLDYMIMFMAAVISMLLYTLMYLRLRGNFKIVGHSMQFTFRANPETGISGDQALKIARKMLLYPVAYTLLICPIAAARFSEWMGHPVPFEVTTFTAAVFLCSGIVNVTLFATTRRILPPDSLRIRISKASISQPAVITVPDRLEEGTHDPYYGQPKMVDVDLTDHFGDKDSMHTRSNSTGSSGSYMGDFPQDVAPDSVHDAVRVGYDRTHNAEAYGPHVSGEGGSVPPPMLNIPQNEMPLDNRRSAVDSVYNMYGAERASTIASYYQYSPQDQDYEPFPEHLADNSHERR